MVSRSFALTVFLGALLLFQIQPLISKFILPWFGGSPGVWTVCMLFFQTMLLLGYAYAHATTRLLTLRGQAGLHLGLLLLAVAMLPITPAGDWKPTGSEDPTWHIVLLLTACIGLPYGLLSATGPLLQSWFTRIPGSGSPYRLYALSNLGSLIALVSYPFVLEPTVGAAGQTVLWSWLFAAFSIACGGCIWLVVARSPQSPEGAAVRASGNSPGWRVIGMWFALAMVPSVMLLASTNQICTDVAVVPFLWILPLTLYLLSFILCFHSSRWCPRPVWSVAWAVAVAIALPAMYWGRGVTSSLSIPAQLAAFSWLLFACAMLCHGELVRRKPDPSHLTSFYLTLAAGGAAGGFFVGVIAPLVFPAYVELSLAIAGCTALFLVVYFRDPGTWLYRGRPRWAWTLLLAASLGVGGVLIGLFQQSLAGVHAIYRNFYGVLQVKLQMDSRGPAEWNWQLIHGRTMHGMQYVEEDKRDWATSYYGPESGIGIVLQTHRAGQPRRIGVVGLGVGTLAAYGQPRDVLRFYEINPASIRLAERAFSYLHHSRARTEIVLGDARIRLDQEPPQVFDVLVLDAFSSDAIPIHLLTREAFHVYLRHLKPGGVLAVHISNYHLDLRPVVAGHARHFGLNEATIYSPGDRDRGTRTAQWCLLAADPKTLEIPELQRDKSLPPARWIDWSDDKNSLFDVLK